MRVEPRAHSGRRELMLIAIVGVLGLVTLLLLLIPGVLGGA